MISGKQNPFVPHFVRFATRLQGLLGVLAAFDAQLGNFRSLLDEIYDRRATSPPPVALSRLLLVNDLTKFPEDGWARPFPVIKPYWLSWSAYAGAADELVARAAGWATRDAYERLETLAYDIAATLRQERKCPTGAVATPTGAAQASWEACRETLKKETRSSLPRLLERLRSEIRRLGTFETQNIRQIDLKAWLEIADQVRHALTHDPEGVIPSACVSKWDTAKVSLLQTWFPGRVEDDGYVLALTKGSADQGLSLFADYGFLLLKLASEATGCDPGELEGGVLLDGVHDRELSQKRNLGS